MLKVLSLKQTSVFPLETQTTVELSDGRQFTIINSSGRHNVDGVPDRTDDLFWSEWDRYVDCLFDEAESTNEEIESYKFRYVPELVGLAEAAEILNLHKNTIKTYMTRGKFPEPIQQLSSGPIWLVEQIKEFKRQQSATARR